MLSSKIKYQQDLTTLLNKNGKTHKYQPLYKHKAQIVISIPWKPVPSSVKVYLTNKKHQEGVIRTPCHRQGELGLRHILSPFFQIMKYFDFIVVRAGHMWNKLAQEVAKSRGLLVDMSWSFGSPLLAAVAQLRSLIQRVIYKKQSRRVLFRKMK